MLNAMKQIARKFAKKTKYILIESRNIAILNKIADNSNAHVC